MYASEATELEREGGIKPEGCEARRITCAGEDGRRGREDNGRSRGGGAEAGDAEDG